MGKKRGNIVSVAFPRGSRNDVAPDTGSPFFPVTLAWIVARTDLMACLFLLLATWLHLRVPDRPTRAELRTVAPAAHRWPTVKIRSC